MHLALVIALLRSPVWLFGLVAMGAAFVFQAAALSHGDLALVQPILLAELPVTLMLAPLFFDVSAGRRAWLGVIGMSAGLAAVLLAAAPSGGRAGAGLAALLLTVVSTAGLAAALVVVAMRLEGSPRAAAFGTAAGAGFALTAALMKEAMSRLSPGGVAAVLSTWEFYAMVAAGAASLFLWQNALQAGTLVAAQPAITLSDPVLATFIGVLVFQERVRLGGWLALEIVGALIVALASVELARAPLVSGEMADAGTRSPPAKDQESQPDLM